MSASATLIPQEKTARRRSALLSVRNWPINLKIGVAIVTLLVVVFTVSYVYVVTLWTGRASAPLR